MPEKNSDDVLYDVRLIERNVAKGLINPKELEKRLSALEDQEPQADSSNLDELMRAAGKGKTAASTALALDRSIN